MLLTSPLFSIAYAPPISYMALLYKYRDESIELDACEHLIKQSWRNRCDIATAYGIQSLTIPIDRSKGLHCPIKELRISRHSNWQHQHKQALLTNYGASPFYEYYWVDIAPLYERSYEFLWDFNWDLLHLLLKLMHINVVVHETEQFFPPNTCSTKDYRYSLHPRKLDRTLLGHYPKYYQQFTNKQGFRPELSIYDLLMNNGPESLLYLRDYPTISQ